MSTTEKLPRAEKRTGYVHTMTYFQGNRWSLHDKVGELLSTGRIFQIAIAKKGADWELSWIDPTTPPDVLKAAAEVDPA